MVKNTEYTLQMVIVDCAKCGVFFGITQEFNSRRRADGQTFYCPHGHFNVYKETLADKLKKTQEELERVRRNNDELNNWGTEQYEQRKQVERRLSSTRGVVTKLQNRIKAGTCPVCRRNFHALAQHMQKQHPDWRALHPEEQAAAEMEATVEAVAPAGGK